MTIEEARERVKSDLLYLEIKDPDPEELAELKNEIQDLIDRYDLEAEFYGEI